MQLVVYVCNRLRYATGRSYDLLTKIKEMKKVLVRYKVKADRVAENETLVRAVYQQLQEKNIEGFSYCTFKLADGVSFVHIALAASEEVNAAFTSLPAFKDFQAGIKDRCDELPVAGPATVVGSFNFQL
jgi:hypothetical protein